MDWQTDGWIGIAHFLLQGNSYMDYNVHMSSHMYLIRMIIEMLMTHAVQVNVTDLRWSYGAYWATLIEFRCLKSIP